MHRGSTTGSSAGFKAVVLYIKAGSRGPNRFQRLRSHLPSQTKPVYIPNSLEICGPLPVCSGSLPTSNSSARRCPGEGPGTPGRCPGGTSPEGRTGIPRQRCPAAGGCPGVQPGWRDAAPAEPRAGGPGAGGSRTEAHVHGVAQGGQGPPVSHGADGRSQPQRLLVLAQRRAAPPLPVRLVHMDGEGRLLLLPAGRPRRRAMALAAAPRRLRGQRPVSAAGSPARPLTAALTAPAPPARLPPHSPAPGARAAAGRPAAAPAPRGCRRAAALCRPGARSPGSLAPPAWPRPGAPPQRGRRAENRTGRAGRAGREAAERGGGAAGRGMGASRAAVPRPPTLAPLRAFK